MPKNLGVSPVYAYAQTTILLSLTDISLLSLSNNTVLPLYFSLLEEYEYLTTLYPSSY